MAANRRPGSSKDWSELSDAYRDRLVRKAKDGSLTGSPVADNKARSAAYNYWRSGGDLRTARGHAPAPTVPSPVAAASRSAVAGEGTAVDRATLRVWRETAAPRWVPPSRSFMADDAAASLAQLGPPRDWGHVHFQPHADGTWGMVTEGAGNRYGQEVTLPDRASAQAVMAMMAGLGPDGEWDGWADWDDWIDDEWDFDVADTDGAT